MGVTDELVYNVADGILSVNGVSLSKNPVSKIPYGDTKTASFKSNLHYGILKGKFSVNDHTKYYYHYTFEKWYDEQGREATDLQWWF